MLEILADFTFVVLGFWVGAWITQISYDRGWNRGFEAGYQTGTRDTWCEASKLVNGAVED